MIPKVHLQYEFPKSVDLVRFVDFETSQLFEGYVYRYSRDELEYCSRLLERSEIFNLIHETMQRDWQDTKE